MVSNKATRFAFWDVCVWYRLDAIAHNSPAWPQGKDTALVFVVWKIFWCVQSAILSFHIQENNCELQLMSADTMSLFFHYPVTPPSWIAPRQMSCASRRVCVCSGSTRRQFVVTLVSSFNQRWTLNFRRRAKMCLRGFSHRRHHQHQRQKVQPTATRFVCVIEAPVIPGVLKQRRNTCHSHTSKGYGCTLFVVVSCRWRQDSSRNARTCATSNLTSNLAVFFSPSVPLPSSPSWAIRCSRYETGPEGREGGGTL